MNKHCVIPAYLLLMVSSVSSVSAREFEIDSIKDLKVVENDDKTELRVSGVDNESGWLIKKTTTKQHGHDIILTLHAAIFATKHATLEFSETLKLTPEIDRVLLGKKRTVIWQRSLPK